MIASRSYFNDDHQDCRSMTRLKLCLLGFAAASLLLATSVSAQIRIQSASLTSGTGFMSSGGIQVGVSLGQSLVGISNDGINAGGVGFWYTTLESITIVSSTIEQVGEEIPSEYLLDQNYPNPFNPTTKIRYGLPEAASVRVTVYNVLGQLVSILIDSDQAPGYYEINWDAKTDAGMSIPSGLYFYRVETKNFSATRSMVFQK